MGSRTSAVVAVWTAMLALVGCSHSTDAPSGCGNGFAASAEGCAPCDEWSAPGEGGGCAPSGLGPASCAKGFTYDAVRHTCEAVVSEASCGAGTMPVLGKTTCEPVGVTACAAGFVSDGDGGCNAVLPTAPCADRLFAIPGEKACREIAGCGTGTWGAIPVEASTLYVDAAYSGTGDGSAAKPFTTVAAALAVVGAGSPIVAVAAGTYVEDLEVKKSVRLMGRCPSMTTLRARTDGGDAVRVAGAPAVTISGVAITGSGAGVDAMDTALRLESVWIHDTAGRGINVRLSKPITEVTLVDSLVERATEVAIEAYGAKIVVERSAIRKTRPVDGKYGRGIVVDTDLKQAGEATLREAVLEGNTENAIAVFSSKATIEGCVFRDTAPRPAGSLLGVGVYAETVGKLVAELVLLDTVVERSTTVGVALRGAKARIERTTVRGTRAPAAKDQGQGIAAQASSKPALASELTLRSSALIGNRTAGLFFSGTTAVVEGTIIRDQLPEEKSGAAGFGISVNVSTVAGVESSLTLRGSLVTRNLEAGVAAFGSKVTIEGSVISHTHPRKSDGLIGRGIDASVVLGQPAELLVSSSIVEQNEETGIGLHGASGTLDGVLIRDTLPASPNIGQLGFGVSASTDEDTGLRAQLVVRSSVVERSSGVGIAVAGSDAQITDTLVRDTRPTVEGSHYGVGIYGVYRPASDQIARLHVERCLVDKSRYLGLFLSSAEADVVASVLRGTLVSEDEGLFGDGVGVDTPWVAARGVLRLRASTVSSNARAGAVTWGADLAMERVLVSCNPLALDQESRLSGGVNVDAKLVDEGGNVCGCGASLGACVAQSQSLAPLSSPVVPER